MSALDDIAQERQRLAERLAKIDTDRARIADQLAELEAAERVLSRFSGTRPGGRRGRRAAAATAAAPAEPAQPRRGRRPAAKATAAKATAAKAAAAKGKVAKGKVAAVPARRGRGARRAAAKAGAPSLGDATLRAVEANGGGVSAEEVRQYLAGQFGMQVRPNHLGMALQRHRRAGRLEQRGSLWFPHHAPGAEAAA